MNQQMIKCPNCGHAFALDEAFAEHFEQEKRQAVAEAVEHAKKKAQEELTTTQQGLQEQFEQELQEQLALISRQVAEETHKKYDLKLAEKEEQMKTIQRQLNELKRKTEQGSQQLQGEALEGRLQELLQSAFPYDEILEVRRGQSGADITHRVFNRLGQHCGTIIWEAKNTKTWGKDWLEKLKSDKSQSGADIMALISVAMPDGIETFDLLEGVWVCCYSAAVAMATALRENLIQISQLQRALQGQDNKMGEVYVYLTGPEFKNHVTHIVETFQAIDGEIEKERAAMERIWKTRSKQLKRVITSTTDMVAELQAIIGKDFAELEPLSLHSLPMGDTLDTPPTQIQ